MKLLKFNLLREILWCDDLKLALQSECKHQHYLKIGIKETLKQLDKRQRAILIMFFGLFGYPELTLEEIARKFNLTRERVRQIKEGALKKLRMIEDGQLRMFLG